MQVSKEIMKLKQIKLPFALVRVPMIDWLPKYTKNEFLSDVVAGFTVFVLLIPQGMAYAVLAGMPPVYGLYTATVPVFIYALLGTSRHISMGPMAITSLLLGTSSQSLGYVDGSPEYIQVILNITMLCGIILYLLGTFRLGVMANFLSHSVLTGFITASALLIAVSQLKYITGIHVPRFDYTHQTLGYLLTHVNQCNEWALLVGLTTWVALYLVKTWKKRNKPNAENVKLLSYRCASALANMSSLIAILLGSLVAYIIVASGKKLDIVGVVPPGLKAPSFAFLDFGTVLNLFPNSFIIAIISFAGNWAIAKKFAGTYNYEVDATQELIAQGCTNIIGVFFNAFVVSGGLARSAVNNESGAKTQMSSVIAGVLIILALLLFTRIFYYIPMAVLGAIIEVSVASMIDFDEMKKAYHVDRNDFAVMVVTFLVTFWVGISQGIFIGVIFSMMIVLNCTAFPQIVHLGKLPYEQGGHFKNIRRFPEATQIPHVAIVRMDASLYFANVSYFREVVMQASTGRFHTSKLPIQLVILDVSCWIDVDLSGINTLTELHADLLSRNIQLAFAYAKGPLRDRLKTTRFIEKLGEQYMSMSIEDAVRTLPSRRSSLEFERTAVESGFMKSSSFGSFSSVVGFQYESEDIFNILQQNPAATSISDKPYQQVFECEYNV